MIESYVQGIDLADKASQMGWFFSNNMTGLFLVNHEDSPEIVDAVREKVSTEIPLEIEAQFGKACEYGNPWAQNALAKHLIRKGRTDEAFPLLRKGMDVGYATAYYTAAMMFFTDKDDQRHLEYLAASSRLGYPLATFELGKIDEETGNVNGAVRLFSMAKEQNLAKYNIDGNLDTKISEHLIALSNKRTTEGKDGEKPWNQKFPLDSPEV